MQATAMPGSCAMMVVHDFNTDDQAAIERNLRQLIVARPEMKTLLATTSTGGDRENWDEDHRQQAANQRAAERALRAVGFRATRRMFNPRHHHGTTGVRVWWLAVNPEAEG